MVAARAHENDVRAATVAAAMRLFAAHGFEGTALQDIADAVGVSKPAVLHHFPSKEHVRQAVLDAILVALERGASAAPSRRDRQRRPLRRRVRRALSLLRRATPIARESSRARCSIARRSCASCSRGSVQPWLGAVAGYIRAGKERGLHYAEVDEEAYLIHVLLLVITATASAAVSSTVLESDARARYDRELARIARASLFPPSTPPRDRHGAEERTVRNRANPKRVAADSRKRKAAR